MGGRIGSDRPQAPVVTRTTKPAAPPPATAPAPAPAPAKQAAVDGPAATRAKGPNLSGARHKAVKVSIPGRADLPAVKAGDLARAAGSPKAMDKKVGEALQRLMIGSSDTAIGLRDELRKLSPSQQLELIKALPFEFREKLTAELKQLPPSERGPQLVWLGDKGLSGLGKDGYVSVTAAPELVQGNGGRPGERWERRTKYPERIDFGNGKVLKAVPDENGAGALLVKLGSKELRAEWKDGAWQWRERSRSGSRGDVLDGKGGFWKELHSANKEEWAMIKAFEAGAQVAQGSTGRFASFGRYDPSTEQLFRDQAIDAQIPGVRKQLDALASAAVKEGEWVKSAAESLAMSQEWIAPALQKGYLTLAPGDDGGLKLELTRAPGMTNGEWRKLQEEFGPKVAAYEKQLQADHSWLATNVSSKERAARDLVSTFFEPAYQKYLGTLPPHERLAEVTRISEAVKGTAAGTSFADSLFSAKALPADGQGNLVPSGFGKTVLEGAWTTPEGREQLRELTLSMAPQLSGPAEDSFVRMFEVMRGKTLSADQADALRTLHDVTSPKEFDALLNPPAGSAPSLVEKAGDLSDLLAELGSANGTDKLRKAGAGLSGSTSEAIAKVLDGAPARNLARGAHAVALFQVARSTRDLFTKGVTLDTSASFAEDATRAIGTWGAIAEAAGKTGFITKLGKVAGPVSDFIGLVNDMRRDASSDEGRYRNGVHVGASALILAGGLAGGPVGVAGVLVGLGVKMLYNRTSESFEEQHATLKRTFGYR